MFDKDFPHPIIEHPHTYRILSMRYQTGFDGNEPHIDLVLERAGIVRILRFWSPRDLVIEKGFPAPTTGMEILDVRSRQMEGIGVRVDDFESSEGSITFWAQDVVDVDREEAN